MARVSLHTLGCKLNYAETSAIESRFRERGYDVVEYGTPSEIVVLNSCTVTSNADRECRHLVRRALRSNPTAFVVVTGCYAQLKPEEIASIDGVDLVLGSAEKLQLFRHAGEFRKRSIPKIAVSQIESVDSFGPAHSGEGDSRTRAFLKVQDGCDYNCSFCTIPLARGASRSDSIQGVLQNAERLVDVGYREIVLTGVNVGDFGRKQGKRLVDLLDPLTRLPGLKRVRISSIEPNLLTDEVIDFCASSPVMMPHFHVPLQSGSDRILGMMRRRYRLHDYCSRIDRVLTAIPDAGIGVDVIVGFPGEEAEDFRVTHDVLHELPVSYFHVFTYSERDNTPAASSNSVVPVPERRRRTRILRNLSEKKRLAFGRRFVGESREILFEAVRQDGGVEGYTDNYIRVRTEDPQVASSLLVRTLEEASLC